jgi:hypothetical protein
MSRLTSSVIGFTLALAGTSLLHAEGSPPLITDDPGTPGPGHWEINIGVSTERRPGLKAAELPLFDLNYGIGETLQLKYEVPYLTESEAGQPRVSGWGNSEVGVKWRFLDTGEGGRAMSVYPQLEFNNPGSSSDDRGLVEHGTAFLLPVQFEQGLGPVTLNLQLGREFRTDGDSWFYGVALSHQLQKKIEIGLELAGTAAAKLERSQLTVNFGVVFEVSEKSSLMFSIGRELHNHEEPKATFVGYVGWQLRP